MHFDYGDIINTSGQSSYLYLFIFFAYKVWLEVIMNIFKDHFYWDGPLRLVSWKITKGLLVIDHDYFWWMCHTTNQNLTFFYSQGFS